MDYKTELEAFARGELTWTVLQAADEKGHTDPVAGLVADAVAEWAGEQPTDRLFETSAAAQGVAAHFNLSPDAAQRVLGMMGRCGARVEFNGLHEAGLKKRLYGREVVGRLWGHPDALSAKEAGIFRGSIQLARRAARGAK